jgi:hypothetical protein
VDITPCAAKRINQADIWAAVKRHASGDWGYVANEHAKRNDAKVQRGDGLILSIYKDSNDKPFALVTLSNREQVFVVRLGGMIWFLVLAILEGLTRPLRRFRKAQTARDSNLD